MISYIKSKSAWSAKNFWIWGGDWGFSWWGRTGPHGGPRVRWGGPILDNPASYSLASPSPLSHTHSGLYIIWMHYSSPKYENLYKRLKVIMFNWQRHSCRPRNCFKHYCFLPERFSIEILWDLLKTALPWSISKQDEFSLSWMIHNFTINWLISLSVL